MMVVCSDAGIAAGLLLQALGLRLSGCVSLLAGQYPPPGGSRSPTPLPLTLILHTPENGLRNVFADMLGVCGSDVARGQRKRGVKEKRLSLMFPPVGAKAERPFSLPLVGATVGILLSLHYPDGFNSRYFAVLVFFFATIGMCRGGFRVTCTHRTPTTAPPPA